MRKRGVDWREGRGDSTFDREGLRLEEGGGRSRGWTGPTRRSWVGTGVGSGRVYSSSRSPSRGVTSTDCRSAYRTSGPDPRTDPSVHPVDREVGPGLGPAQTRDGGGSVRLTGSSVRWLSAHTHTRTNGHTHKTPRQTPTETHTHRRHITYARRGTSHGPHTQRDTVLTHM